MKLTDKNFEKEVLEADKPVLVDFWGSWCTACQRMKPVIKKLEKSLEGAKVGYLNIDKNPRIAAKYDIEETPTHILFKGGEAIEEEFGAMSEAQLKAMIKEKLK